MSVVKGYCTPCDRDVFLSSGNGPSCPVCSSLLYPCEELPADLHDSLEAAGRSDILFRVRTGSLSL